MILRALTLLLALTAPVSAATTDSTRTAALTADATSAGSSGLRYERLDQLLVEHLLGARD